MDVGKCQGLDEFVKYSYFLERDAFNFLIPYFCNENVLSEVG